MRVAFSEAVINQCNRSDYFFLTGDLGFMALEAVRSTFQTRFINAGVAEQNMIGVAAGLAKEGYKVFVYSIAPFCYARPFEQIRNDICMGMLPVCIVGNGGGYAYGHMGPTHHALEDCAAMNALGVKVLVPAFDEDLPHLLHDLVTPTYLRLGYDAKPPNVVPPHYSPWRQILDGKSGVIAALGPLAGVAWTALQHISPENRPAVWAVCEFDSAGIPELFYQQINNNKLIVLEEHVESGGLGAHLALTMIKKGCTPKTFIHHYAQGYPTGRFGSQSFHRIQSGLDQHSIQQLCLGNS